MVCKIEIIKAEMVSQKGHFADFETVSEYTKKILKNHKYLKNNYFLKQSVIWSNGFKVRPIKSLITLTRYPYWLELGLMKLSFWNMIMAFKHLQYG